MGLQKVPLTFRFDGETVEQIDQIQKAFAPFAEDRASTLRVVVKLVWLLLFTPTSLKDVLAVMQRLSPHTSEYRQLSIRFPSAIPFQPRFGRRP